MGKVPPVLEAEWLRVMLGYVDNDEDGIDIAFIIRLLAKSVKKGWAGMTVSSPKESSLILMGISWRKSPARMPDHEILSNRRTHSFD